MNINELMKKMRKSQQILEQKHEEINKKEFSIEKQGVSIVILGTKEIQKITIDPELLDPQDADTLEMLLMSALNEIFKKIDQEFEKVEASLSQNMPF